MDCPIWGTDDISDEELLKELEAVKNMAVPLPIPSPSPDEFEKIWARIQEERAESKNVPESDQPEHPKVIKPRFGWKRLAAVGLIACLVAGSGCMVAMGTKSYFYRGRVRTEFDNGIVFNNDSNKIAVNGEEEAYVVIEKELGIKPLKLEKNLLLILAIFIIPRIICSAALKSAITPSRKGRIVLRCV